MRSKTLPLVLLVGVGRWGENHLRAWLKLQAKGLCQFAGIYDSDPERIKVIQKEFSVRAFKSLDQGFSEALVVDVAVPTQHHFAVTKAALLAGKDVLVEKPLTETVSQAKELESIIISSSSVFMVGHLFKYNPALDHVTRLISEGEIGKIRFLRGRFMGFRFKERDAGILATTAIHFIYLSNHLMGREPQTVSAKVHYLLDKELDDVCSVRLDYGDDQFSLIDSDYFGPVKQRSFDIVGTQGIIQFDALTQDVTIHQKKHMRIGDRFEVYDGTTTHFPTQFQEPLFLELSHFLDCVKERNNPRTGIDDGINILRIIEAAYQSSRSDKIVVLYD